MHEQISFIMTCIMLVVTPLAFYVIYRGVKEIVIQFQNYINRRN